MSYRIVYPVAMPIDGNDFRDAVKKYIKLNHFMNIEQIILTDQYKHMKANVRYYNNKNHRKASIQLVPIDAGAIPAIVGFSSSNPNAPYPGVMPGSAFAVGPSRIGGPAGIIAPAPVMVGGPAMIGGPVIGGPMMGGPIIGGPMMGGPMMGGPIIGGPGVSGVIYGARPAETSNEIIRIDEINNKVTATTKEGKQFEILKIEKVNNNQYRVTCSSGKISIINTNLTEGRILFNNKKFKPEDDEDSFDITDVINKSTSVSVPSYTPMTVGPTHVITNSRQILPVAPINPIGTDGRPVGGIISTFGRGPLVGVPSVLGRPSLVVGGPMMVGQPVRFGRGVY
jgi:hypothetical protein